MVYAAIESLNHYLEAFEVDVQSGLSGDFHFLQTGLQPLAEKKSLNKRKNRVQNTGLEKSHDPPET